MVDFRRYRVGKTTILLRVVISYVNGNHSIRVMVFVYNLYIIYDINHNFV